MAKNLKLFGIYLTPEMHQTLRVVAAKENLNVSQYIRNLISENKDYQKEQNNQKAHE